MKHKHSTDQTGSVGVLALGLMVLALLGLIGWLVATNQQRASTTKQAADTTTLAGASDASRQSKSTEQTDTRDTDKKTTEYKLNGLLTAYRTNNGHFLEASATAWDGFVGKYKAADPAAFIDPYTGGTYTFTTSTPEYGQIQYRFPASCNDARSDFVTANTKQSWAFRLKYSTGVQCMHNI